MLSDYPPVAALAVSDLARAREFYEGTLGLTPEGEAAGGLHYGAGGSRVLVYPSAYAGTNKATAVTFDVPADAFDGEVAALRDKGVTFITFEAPGVTWDGEVATIEGERAVWFSDPDGNILALGTPTQS